MRHEKHFKETKVTANKSDFKIHRTYIILTLKILIMCKFHSFTSRIIINQVVVLLDKQVENNS